MTWQTNNAGPARRGSTTNAQRTSVQATVARMTAIAGPFVVVTFLVLSASRAAFTATTANSGNSVAAGTVSLVDNDVGAAMFALTDLSPGANFDRCIEVEYTGSIDPQVIKLDVVHSSFSVPANVCSLR